MIGCRAIYRIPPPNSAALAASITGQACVAMHIFPYRLSGERRQNLKVCLPVRHTPRRKDCDSFQFACERGSNRAFRSVANAARDKVRLPLQQIDRLREIGHADVLCKCGVLAFESLVHLPGNAAVAEMPGGSRPKL
jgi:hypothetical protein